MQHLLVFFYWLYPCIMLYVILYLFVKDYFHVLKEIMVESVKIDWRKNQVQLSCSNGELSSLQFKTSPCIYTVGPASHHTLRLHFTNMAAWSISKCLTHWHPIHVFVCLFLFFLYFPQCIFLSYCKAFNKKKGNNQVIQLFSSSSLCHLCRSHNNKLQSAASQLPPKNQVSKRQQALQFPLND